jgi:plasmid replication initiation protein
METKKITKSNSLVEASYRLSLNEIRIVLYGISLINSVSNEFPMSYEIDVQKFCTYFGINAHDRNFYKEIREAIIERFWEREFGYWDVKQNKFVKRRILSGIDYNDQLGQIKIYYNHLIKDQLQELSGNFTTYRLEHVAHMKSVYGVRIYEFCLMKLNKSQKPKISFSTPIESLKQQLMLEDKYQRFCDFKRFVLETAKREISKHSDINVSYETIKRGRSPHEINFTVSRKITKEGRETYKKQMLLKRKEVASLKNEIIGERSFLESPVCSTELLKKQTQAKINHLTEMLAKAEASISCL